MGWEGHLETLEGLLPEWAVASCGGARAWQVEQCVDEVPSAELEMPVLAAQLGETREHAARAEVFEHGARREHGRERIERASTQLPAMLPLDPILRRYTADLAERHGFRQVSEKIAGWPEHYFGPRVQASHGELLFIGEAWGIDALLGEGIAPRFAISAYAAKRLKSALDRGSRRVRGYELGFFATQEGRNLPYQHRLADTFCDEAPHRWLRVLFSSSALLRAATSGDEAYGRLAHLAPRLGLDFVTRTLRGRRIPSAAPLRAPNPRYAFD